MQWSKKLKVFFQFFTAFLKAAFNFEHFGKKDEPHSSYIFEIIDGEKSAYVNV